MPALRLLPTLTAALVTFATGWAPTAFAHIVFEQKTATAGSYFKGTLMVGHGCNGSATRAITVTIPEGVQGAHPQPKAGWQLETKRAQLAKPYTAHGKIVSEDVRTLRWFNGSLADAHFDEFVMLMKLPTQPGKVYFQVLQECEGGSVNWSEVPAEGQGTRGLKTPAAELEITAPMPAAHVHAH